MVMGMSYEQFWNESPSLVLTYRKAFRIKRELENEMAWIQGLYIYDAVAVCLQNVLRKRGQKRESYIEKPIDIFPLTPTEKKRREREEMIKTQKTLEQMRQNQIARRKKSEAKSPKKEVVNDGRVDGNSGDRGKTQS